MCMLCISDHAVHDCVGVYNDDVTKAADIQLAVSELADFGSGVVGVGCYVVVIEFVRLYFW